MSIEALGADHPILRVGEEPLKLVASAFGGGCGAEYTQGEIELRMCSRAGCGRMGGAAWSGCADENLHRPLCPECDIELNRMVLEWWGDPQRDEKITEYANHFQMSLDRPLELDWLVRWESEE